jgi:LacI family transcriptional regulator
MIKRAAKGPPSLPRVAVLLETGAGSGRDMMRGIARYVTESGPWALHHEPRMSQFVEGWTPKWLGDWEGAGIIGRFKTHSILAAVKRAKVPAVDILGTNPRCPYPLVQPDNAAVARLAAEHLVERGIRRFAYVGTPAEAWSNQRSVAFQKSLAERNLPCLALQIEFKNLHESWDSFIEQTTQWIRRQQKPLGLMLCWDTIGPPITQACRQAGVAIPEEVAIVGVDNDETACSICDPPLTSVCPNHEEVGYQAAALLDRMMAGESIAKQQILVQPRTIIIRQSSDIPAIEDPAIAKALRMIREHACNGLQVREIAEHLPISRSVLQRRFQSLLGRSVHDEILRLQLRKAEELLRETKLSIGAISRKSGFRHPDYMAALFKTRTGLTPRKYRSRCQNSAAIDGPARSKSV